MHNAAFKALGMDDWHYDMLAIPPDIVRLGIREPKQHGYIGINVTVPHKQAIMEYTRPDEKARAIGAVNTIRFSDDLGTNTDVDGLIGDLKAHDVALDGEKVLVLGAGGAARSAVYGLWQQGARIVIVNRTRERAEKILSELAASGGVKDVGVLTIDEGAEWDPSLIVNCTSAGMWPNTDDSPWITGVPFPKGVTVYDMVYRPAKTKLMQQAETHAGRAIGGLGMLVRQGAAAFEIWTGVTPPVEVMFDAVRQELENRG